jgi:hypothetical protein
MKLEDILKQFLKDLNVYKSIDPRLLNLDYFTEKWVEQMEGFDGKKLVKDSDKDLLNDIKNTMKITREQARQIFMAGAMWEQGATDQNFEDVWNNLLKLGKLEELKIELLINETYEVIDECGTTIHQGTIGECNNFITEYYEGD